jgi:PAS domain S-box-containing protein
MEINQKAEEHTPFIGAETDVVAVEERYRILSELTSDFAFGGHLLPNGIQVVEWVTEAFSRVLGYSAQELATFGWEMLLAENERYLLREQEVALRTGGTHTCEHRVFSKSGTVHYLHTVIRSVGQDVAGLPRFIGVCQEISERKRAEQERLRQQREIENLNSRLRRTIQETHHRVKNNLQVINSLLEMQIVEGRDTIQAEDVRRILQHIGTLAMLHDLMTEEAKESGDVNHIPLRTILDRLLASLTPILHGRQVDLDIADVALSIPQVTPFSILVNECLSNAVCHGAGDITLRVQQEDRKLHLTISDQGKGFPANFDPACFSTTGLELMETATRWDLQGEITYMNPPEGGACIEVVFPLVLPPT